MKRFAIFLVLVLVLSFSFSGIFASAEEVTTYKNGTYKATEAITVYTMHGRKEVALFSIPATYYFDIIGKDEAVYFISYSSVIGTEVEYFIQPTSKFIVPLATETAPKNGVKLPVNLTKESKDVQFYKNTYKGFSAITINKATTTLYLIGGYVKHNNIDSAFVAVEDSANSTNNGYGYIDRALLETKDGASLTKYEIPMHVNSIPPVDDPGKDSEIVKKPTEPKDDKIVKIILIIGIVVPALIIIFLLFKPSNSKQKHRYDYNRNRGGDIGQSPYDQPRSRYTDERDEYYDRDRYRDRDDRGRDDRDRYRDRDDYDDRDRRRF
ncbi:MAG: hypothetical protein RR357_01000 [Clostridia bacterium]